MKELPKEVLEGFVSWYCDYPLSNKEDCYKDKINKEYLSSIGKEKFIEFFYEFVSVGGEIQSGGHRLKNGFRETVKNNFASFRTYILKTFDDNFNIEDWIVNLKNYHRFGIGAATIFLNRVDKNKYAILNKKTRDGLRIVGCKISSSDEKAYLKVLEIQYWYIQRYPEIFKNYYQIDAFMHYLVGVEEGKRLAIRFLGAHFQSNKLLPEEISNPDDYLEGAKKTITVNAYERDPKARKKCIDHYGNKYECQVCGDSLTKKYGKLAKGFIHVHHIIPISERGQEYKIDPLNDLIPVCPNCHAMLHRMTPCLSIEKLREIIKKQKLVVYIIFIRSLTAFSKRLSPSSSNFLGHPKLRRIKPSLPKIRPSLNPTPYCSKY